MDTRSHLRLVLFDIDGTLLTTNGEARRTFGEAVAQVFERDDVPGDHDFAGKTDQQIYYEVTARMEIPRDAADAKKERMYAVFLDLLSERLNVENVHTMPGVPTLLEALCETQVATLALLTGNLLRGAQIKLTPPQLNHYFGFGAFGNDALYRYQLPAIALERAYKRTGYTYRAKEIVIIGDTPNDIECGRHLNVRTIAVATGGATPDTLAAHRPDFLFENLTDTEAVLQAIYS
jgi:phosphoglycolate phosphatase